MNVLKNYKIRDGKALMLRCCGPHGESAHNGFVWPSKPGAKVTCPDWDPKPECGNGLHGWLHGEGDVMASRFHSLADALWLVVEVDTAAVVTIDRKVKVPAGRIVASGNRHDVCSWLAAMLPGRAVIYATVTGGDRATVTGGDRATVTGVDGATVTGGDRATVTGGYGATVTGGHGATVTGGDRATVTGGDRAILAVKWHDGRRYRLAVGYVGEDGIEPGKPYYVVNGKFVVRQ